MKDCFMTKEEELFRKHLSDLADMAWRRGIVAFSEFCGLNELNIFYSSRQEFSAVQAETFGGYDSAERQMIAFIPDALSYEWHFPVSALEIRPLNAKFSDELTHRDYLGSLMNLGIDRSRLGDILVSNENAVLFCDEKMAAYICSQLSRVKHTSVSCRICDPSEAEYQVRTEEISGSVASVRLDSLIALAFHLSRSTAVNLIEEGRTFVNGRMTSSNGAHLKEGDIISVRGQGRFCLDSLQGISKKGRQFVRLLKYV